MGNDADGYASRCAGRRSAPIADTALYGDADRAAGCTLWGLSQLYFSDGRIVEDWMLFNEFDVLAQILRDEPVAIIA